MLACLHPCLACIGNSVASALSCLKAFGTTCVFMPNDTCTPLLHTVHLPRYYPATPLQTSKRFLQVRICYNDQFQAIDCQQVKEVEACRGDQITLPPSQQPTTATA